MPKKNVKLQDISLEELWELFPIILRPHNPEYALWYGEEQLALTNILKDCGIFRINHIGSTAVKGLIAKPTVDILLELGDGYDRKTIIEDILEKNGWIVMARDDAAKTIDLNKGYTPKGFAHKVFHLHIKPPGDWSELYFRDYLQKYSDIAGKYELLKLDLKEKFERNRNAYTTAKSDFIQKYTRTARDEFGERYTPHNE
ncbi:MAG: GrpB family protein [Chitinispirillales bacterium]|jgi:GrpB-like predicted nucleotidyltransferase (UPF0157 family)|nr:GrpB family protein [Chitinispirillales bacterium]